MKENKTKPDIRFKGFTDDWEQRKLGEIVGIYDGVHQTPKYQDSGIMFLSVENISTLQSTKYISEEDFKRDYKVYPQENDILMTRIGDVGTTNVVTDNTLKAYYVSLALLKYKNTNPYFLSNAMQSNYVQKGLANRTLKTAVPMKINKDEIGKVDVILTAAVEEQSKIGSYFKNLDNLITLHQRECNQLKELKKTMLKKMFPRDGSNIPEVRFAGFTDDWEQRKLGDVTQIIMGQSPDGSTYSETPKDYILVQGNSDIKDGWVEPRLWTTQVTKKADVGDLIMSVRAPAGSMGKTAYNVVIGRGVAAIKGNEFIFQSLIKKDIEGFWKKITTGSTFESLNSNDIKNSNLLVPVNEEQIKIGQYFSQLDNLITLHQREKRKDFRKKINIIVGYMNLVIIYKDYGKEENMATRGKSINLFLMDGEASGRIKCTLANWTGLAYKIPRIDLDRCKSREDLKQSGVYFLFGKSENSEKGIVYIGQAGARKNGEGILDRLKEHKRNSKKDYWTEAIVFTTSNNSFGPTEISYLENRFCNLAKQANRYEVKNENDPTMGNITEEKESEMEEFIDYAKVVMGTLGHKVFEPYAKSNVDNQNDISYDTDENNTILYLKRKVKEFGEVQAPGMQTSDGFVVFSGSHISTEDDNTVPQVLKERKKTVKLDENGNLIDNMPFSSPSYAAMFVIGKSANGLVSWKDENGKTLKDLELNK